MTALLQSAAQLSSDPRLHVSTSSVYLGVMQLVVEAPDQVVELLVKF